MFFMQLLMNKRGPLSKIWLAAHWDKKVTKAHIFECNLEDTIEKILSPKFKIALRTSGHLLLGVVRIYHRKTKYLLTDCNEALLKMQSTFQPGLVDLPKGNSEAIYDAITLPEEFHDFDTQLPDMNAIEVTQHFTLHQSKIEDITLTEFYGQNLSYSSIFLTVEEIEIPRHASFFSDSLINSSNSLLADHSSSNLTGDKTALEYDGFGDEEAGRDMIGRYEQNPKLGSAVSKHETKNHQRNETTLLFSEEDGFVPYPIKRRSKRKGKLLIDPVKQLSKATMQKQLTNYEDTLAPLQIAPPTRKLMILQELGSVDKLMTRPTQPLSALSSDLLPSSSIQQESENEQAALQNHSEQQGAKSFSFLSLCKNQNKKEAAENFYSLLVLQKQRVIEVAQSAPYADIIVTAGPKFHTF
uniref:RAD21 cohesin complex component like 1 n=1 Tax=Laticauda laticaudata TaxID=8630 RepID=A0A8C5WTF9_LATLA